MLSSKLPGFFFGLLKGGMALGEVFLLSSLIGSPLRAAALLTAANLYIIT